MKKFKNGYALIIGLSELEAPFFGHPHLDGVANAEALAAVLTDKNRSDYRNKNVITLTGPEATRKNIIRSFQKLEKRMRKDERENKTLLVYFSGMEYRSSQGEEPAYFLLPYDASGTEAHFFSSLLNGDLFKGLIQTQPHQHLLLIKDCEPVAGQETIQEPGTRATVDPPPPPPPPPEEDPLRKTGPKPIPVDLPSDYGRYLLTAAAPGSLSYTPRGKKLGLFTRHLIEAMSGETVGEETGQRQVVMASEVTAYVSAVVPAVARAMGVEQQPVQKNNGIDFPVGLIRGGKGASKKKKKKKKSDAPQVTGGGSGQPGQVTTGTGPDSGPTFVAGGSREDQEERPKPDLPPLVQNTGGRVFALLIGIDNYDRSGADLFGCVRDSREVERYLKESVFQPENRLLLHRLRSPLDQAPLLADTQAAQEENDLPTRANIVAAFRDFLTQAGPEDTVFVHYSGHGTRVDLPEELWELEPEKEGEAIVPSDGYTLDNQGKMVWPLTDLEIRYLLNQVADAGAHLVLALDSCHSGGGTREFGEMEGMQVRFSRPDALESRMVVSDFLFHGDFEAWHNTPDTNGAPFELPEGRHLALSASHSYELAKEMHFPEGRHGVLTYYLLQTLRATHGQISYRDLTKLVRAKAINTVAYQSPQYYASFPADANLTFLAGTVGKNQQHYTVRPNGTSSQGTMDAGALHGLPPASEGRTWVSLFGPDVDLWEAKPDQIRRGFLTEIGPQESTVEFEEGTFPADTPFLKAAVTATPLPKTKVCIVGEVDAAIVDIPERPDGGPENGLGWGAELLQDALRDNAYLELVEVSDSWQFRLFVYRFEGQEKYRIARRDEVKALVEPQVGFTAVSVQALVEEMVHIARWERTLQLENPHNPVLRPGDVELVVLDKEDNEWPQQDGEILLEQRQNEDGTWTKPQLKFKVAMKNHGQAPLYCALLHLGADFNIDPNFLPPDTQLGSRDFVDDGKRLEWERWEVFAGSHIEVDRQTVKRGLPLAFNVRDEWFDRGIHEMEDHFKLIVSTEQFDAMHLYQGALNDPSGTRDFEPPKVQSSLDALMQEVRSRDAGWATGGEKRSEQLQDWMTQLVTVRTKRVVE